MFQLLSAVNSLQAGGELPLEAIADVLRFMREHVAAAESKLPEVVPELDLAIAAAESGDRGAAYRAIGRILRVLANVIDRVSLEVMGAPGAGAPLQ